MYKILRSKDLEFLERRVAEAMMDGYYPHGSLVVKERDLIQPMIHLRRYREAENKNYFDAQAKKHTDKPT